jgi:hypothetical protein
LLKKTKFTLDRCTLENRNAAEETGNNRGDFNFHQNPVQPPRYLLPAGIPSHHTKCLWGLAAIKLANAQGSR